jgi:hypothetical protein
MWINLTVLILKPWRPFPGSRYFCESLFWASQPKQAAKITRQPMPPAAPAVLLHSLDTRQGASNIILAMTRRDVGIGESLHFHYAKSAS